MKRTRLVLALLLMVAPVFALPPAARAAGIAAAPGATEPSTSVGSTGVSAPAEPSSTTTAPGAQFAPGSTESASTPDRASADEIETISPEKRAEVEARSQAYLEEVRQQRAQQPASRAAESSQPASFGSASAIETPDFMPWVGNAQTWCTYSNPGSPGNYCAGYHAYAALDIGMPVGTSVVAAGSGRVVDVASGCVNGNTSCGGGAGNYVSIMHVDPSTNVVRYTRYMHMASVSVAVNQNVTKGQQIGASGWSGNVQPTNVSAAHLHYEEDLARYGTPTEPGEMYACAGGSPVAALGSRGYTSWNQMPWGTMLPNENAACVGADADGDGVVDGIDNCPDVAGPPAADGCDYDQMSAARTKADFNDDGRGDVAFLSGPGASGSQLLISYGQAGGGMSAASLVWDSGGFGWEWDRLKLAAGDVNGDGNSDLLLLYSLDGGSTMVFLAAGSGAGLSAPSLVWRSDPGALDLTKTKVTVGDYNGDGYADLGLVTTGIFAIVAIWIGAGGPGGLAAPAPVWQSAVGFANGDTTRVVAGDFGGDGRGDAGLFVQVDPSRAQLWVAAGTTGGSGEPSISPPQMVWDSGAGGWDAERTKVSAADYDGDGRSDFALLRGYGGLRTTLSIAYGIGVGVDPPQQVWDSGPGLWDWQLTKMASCDSSGSGRARVGLFVGGADNVSRLYFTGGDGSGGWVAPQQAWMAEGWDARRTLTTGCDLVTPVAPSKYHALAPARLLDSRDGTGGYRTPWGPGERRDVTVLGSAGIPSTGVSSVVLNVTVTAPTEPSFLTVWPAGLAKPLLSSLNYVGGQTVANQVIVKVGAGGKISMYNAAGTVQVIADVLGYYDGGTGDTYNPVVPSRILDSRDNTGGYDTKWGPGESRDVQVTGVGGVPASGVSAVLVNVTATDATAPSHLTAWPSGQSRPMASVLNFAPGTTVPNLVLATVGANGKVSIFNNQGSVNVVADVVGWFGPGAGSRYAALAGSRIVDSRFGIGGPAAPWSAGETRDVQVTQVGGVPATGVTAVVLNVTVDGPTAASHVTAWPAGQGMPVASNLNFVAGQTVPNLVVVKVGAGGKVSLFNNVGSTHMIADVVGYYS
ncbi:MAG: M23 family metallopeptidase [Actinobacteria bacterium]|nr:M23 family metallopeptidase [Actinomycetota bacterium]